MTPTRTARQRDQKRNEKLDRWARPSFQQGKSSGPKIKNVFTKPFGNRQSRTPLYCGHSKFKRRKRGNFSFEAKRRREIVLHARLVGASDNHLIAWVWNNPKAIEAYEKIDLKFDPIWLLQSAAWSMGRKISEAEASAIYEKAMTTPKRKSADSLAFFLNVTWDQRQALGITTIGSTDVRKDDREEIRKVRDKVRKEKKRRARGVQPRSEYLLKSLSRTQPWKYRSTSRRTWERDRRQQAIRLRYREDTAPFGASHLRLRKSEDAASFVACRNSVGSKESKYAADTLATRSKREREIAADTLASTKPTPFPDVPQWQPPEGLTPAVRRAKERLEAGRRGNEGGWYR